jgi:(p)ppGpp synthase/HD superfamily hydrolase
MTLEATMTSSPLLLAEEVARNAHGNDLNKHNGERYIRHVERVVEHLRRFGAKDDVLIVAWLHDTVEDTWVTLDDLSGFGVVIVNAVNAITHRQGESRLDYYQRVGANRLALTAKLSDLRDNTDPARRVDLPEATRLRLELKYQTAHRALIPWLIHHLKEGAR